MRSDSPALRGIALGDGQSLRCRKTPADCRYRIDMVSAGPLQSAAVTVVLKNVGECFSKYFRSNTEINKIISATVMDGELRHDEKGRHVIGVPVRFAVSGCG
jgi:hypothetical protein